MTDHLFSDEWIKEKANAEGGFDVEVGVPAGPITKEHMLYGFAAEVVRLRTDLQTQQEKATLLEGMINRSGFEPSTCCLCGKPSLSWPDGMSTFCEACAQKNG